MHLLSIHMSQRQVHFDWFEEPADSPLIPNRPYIRNKWTDVIFDFYVMKDYFYDWFQNSISHDWKMMHWDDAEKFRYQNQDKLSFNVKELGMFNFIFEDKGDAMLFKLTWL